MQSHRKDRGFRLVVAGKASRKVNHGDPLLSLSPVGRVPALMCNRKNADFFLMHRINQRIRKVFHDMTTLATPPRGAKAWMLQQELH